MVKEINIKFRNMYYAAIFLFLLFTGSTCRKDKDCQEDSHNAIEIENNSSKTINWRHFNLDSVYILNGAPYDEILPSNQSTLYKIRTETCWEIVFRDSALKYFLIFDNDTVQAIGWQRISGTNRGLLKRVKVDLDYLENNNFTIAYP